MYYANNQCNTLEEKFNGPVRDMLALERDLLSASKKEESYRSEEMKVETFRMSLVERFAEYMESYNDFFKRGASLLGQFSEEVSKTKTASRKAVEEILNTTLEVDAEEEALAAAQLPPPAIFLANLDDTIRRDNTSIPRIVLHIIAYLDQVGLSQMGIFRISGHNGSVQALKEAIDSGHEVDLTLLKNVHVAATLFKLYLRTLPDTLTQQARFDEWIAPFKNVLLSANPDGTTIFPPELVSVLTALVDSLPPNSARTLDYVIQFCTRVVALSEQNMMGAKNLASLIAPNILNRAEDGSAGATTAQGMLEDVSQANKVVECMMVNYSEVFKNVDYELKHNPILSLPELTEDYPLCADRNIKHGVSVIVDLPAEDGTIPENNAAGNAQKADDRRKHVKKKTLSSLSLVKDRKLKKKEKTSTNDRATVALENDRSQPDSWSRFSPRAHMRMNSEKGPASDAKPKSPRELTHSLKEEDLTSSSEGHAALASSTSGAGQKPTKHSDALQHAVSAPIAHDHHAAITRSLPTNPGSSSGATTVVPPVRLAASSSTTQASVSGAVNPEKKKTRKGSRQRGSSAAPPVRSSVSRASTSGESPPIVEPTTTFEAKHKRRHSIGLAEGEGLDPTKENFGVILPASTNVAPAALSSKDGTVKLSVEALVDDQSGSLRGRLSSRRGSVLGGNPFTSPRSGSISARDRPGFLTPTKLRFTDSQESSSAASSLPSTEPTITPPPTKDPSPPRATSPSPSSSSPSPAPGKETPTKDGNSQGGKKKDRTASMATLKFENPEEFNALMNERFGKGPIASYVVLGYSGPQTVRMQAGGEGGVTELVQQLKDDQIQYGLIRITYFEDGNPLTRDVFVQWNGPKVSAIQKGIKKAHCGELKSVLCPTAIEILASSKTNFTLETLVARSAPTASRIID